MVRNYVRISFQGASPERFINLCRNKNIQIWDVKQFEDRYECCLVAKDFRKIKPLVKKTRIGVKIKERHGLIFKYHQYRKRWLFFGGSILGLIVIFLMTGIIWSIDIEGNQKITDDILYDYLESIEVKHGMRRKDVFCEEICTILRKDFPEIIWVSTSLEGTKLKITIRESMDTEKEPQNEELFQDIYAKEDGIIVEIVTRKGVPAVKQGDEVKSGDLLVSGTLDIKNDAGEVIRKEHVQAEADIVMKSKIPFEAFCSNVHEVKTYFHTNKKRVIVHGFSYQIVFGVRKTEGLHEVKSEFMQLSIGENFKLPIKIELESNQEYILLEEPYKEEEQKIYLEEQFQWFQKALEEGGAEILDTELTFMRGEKGLFYKGYVEVLQQVVVDLY